MIYFNKILTFPIYYDVDAFLTFESKKKTFKKI